MKKGDKIRIIMCCYPLPVESMLGRVYHVSEVYDGYIRISELDINVKNVFVEKVDEHEQDIDMLLNESTMFDINKVYSPKIL